MSIYLRPYHPDDTPAVLEIWNEVIEEGGSIPFVEPMTAEFLGMILGDAENVVAVETDAAPTGGQVDEAADVAPGAGSPAAEQIVGMYSVHPNMLGRCSHIANATYLVKAGRRGEHIGEKLVLDSIAKAKEMGFRAMQFNGVVKSNVHARNLYERCGFRVVGEIPESFQVKDGHYENGLVMYRAL